MASSSTSTSRTWKYDVFPSFSGEDVRKTFLSHLLEKLRSKLIVTFIDHGIERSRPIAPELLSAINESMISIIVFSKNYASSTWCLNELVEIYKCYKELRQIMVIPVFYSVDPSDVRKQTGDFGNNFKETCKRTTEDVKQKWIQALEEVASIAGEDSRNWKNEADMIEQISKDVSNKLFTQSEDFGDFVGMDAHIEALNSMLCLETEEVRMVGIVGPSGIGKSTIARALFNRLSSRFDNRAFVSYKRTIQDDYGMKLAWEKQFLSDILGQKDIKLDSLGVVERRIKNKKVLIVVDDVDDLKLLETIVGKIGWFGCGSRIVVVTQDRHILKSHEIELIYEVGFPSADLALEMLCRSAFGQNSPPDGFMELAVEVAKLAGNLPLGLNVLGSSLRRRDKEEWVKMLPRLQDGLDGKIEKTLRISYDALDRKDQDLFIHIACFLSGKRVNYIEDLLKDTANTGLIILAEKSLIRITSPYETVEMHNLLRAMGREIVRAEYFYNPGKRRFLVNAEDISDVFEDNTGSDSVLGIICKTSEFSEPLSMDKEAFKRMHNLQFLKFYKERWVRKTGEGGLYLPQGLVYLPRKLRLLHWDEYPAKYIPSNFIGDHLVEFKMKNSKLEKMWEGTKPLRSLKKISMRYSKDLKEIPDLSNAKNLNILDLEDCTSLVTLPSSIQNLNKLKSLVMKGCRSLEVLPNDVNLESLESLVLGKNSRLRCFPRISRNISRLYLDGTSMEEDDSLWIENLLRLTLLDWENCPLRCMPSNFHPEHLAFLSMINSKLEKLWTGVQSLESLVGMNLSQSGNLKELPDLSKAINLKAMNLKSCVNLKEIPDLSNATSLRKLNLSGCKSLTEIPNLSKATSLVELDLSGCENLKEIPDLSTSLETLSLNYCKSLVTLPSSFRNLYKLRSLDMRACTCLVVLPTDINLVSLIYLDLSECSLLTSFPQISMSLEYLKLNDTAIEEVPSWIQNIAGLALLWMERCKKLRKISATIWNLKQLRFVDFTGSSGLTSITDASLVKSISKYYRFTKEFHFVDCFNLDRDAHELILKSDFFYSSIAMPGEEVPTYFTHRTCGSSLTVPLSQSFLSHGAHGFLQFKACIILEPKWKVRTTESYYHEDIIIHWKFRTIQDSQIRFDVNINSFEMDHLVVFDFHICNREEIHGPLSQLDCDNVEFEFKLKFGNKQSTINRIKGCGIRILDFSPSMDRSSGTEYNQQDGDNGAQSERSSEAEYNHQSGESDAESERSKKRMKMTVVTSQKPPNLPVAGTGIHGDLNLELSLCLGGASSNIHGDGTLMYLEEEDLYVDPMITEQQDTGTLIEDHLSSPQLINFLR